MAAINITQMYLNVLSKQWVSVNGSPTTFPPLYYGDTAIIVVFPVVPASSNPQQGFVAYAFAGYTANLTMADTPNAANPPTPFASYDSAVWDANLNAFVFPMDLTQAEVGTFIGAAAAKQAYINVDVFDAALKRNTLLQSTFTMNASIDTVIPGPPANPVQYMTVQQALGLFLRIAPFPGKFVQWQSDDGTKIVTESLDNTGAKVVAPQ